MSFTEPLIDISPPARCYLAVKARWGWIGSDEHQYDLIVLPAFESSFVTKQLFDPSSILNLGLDQDDPFRIVVNADIRQSSAFVIIWQVGIERAGESLLHDAQFPALCY